MCPRFGIRRSAIVFDAGSSGVRACQVRVRGAAPSLCDVLSLDLNGHGPHNDAPAPSAPGCVASRLARLVGQGRFTGRDVALVLAPPAVHFHALRVPDSALSASPVQLRKALAWEIARETRAEPNELEVRHWRLPRGHRQQLNVMAVAMPAADAAARVEAFAAQGLHLNRMDVLPRALARAALQVWQPGDSDVWCIADLGHRHAHLTMLIGRIPVYVRSLSDGCEKWTRRLAETFEVSFADAEQLKRRHGILSSAPERGVRCGSAPQSLLSEDDVSGILFGVLRDELDALVRELNLCFSYVLQSYPDHNVSRLFLAGGGANLPGVAQFLEIQLDLPVPLLCDAAIDPHTSPVRDNGLPMRPESAAVVGGSLLDVEGA